MTGSNTLKVLLGKKLVATICLDHDQLQWTYTQDWILNGFAISPHLPLYKTVPTINVQRFLRNLLPEANALAELTSYYNLSKSNTFALVRALGLDIPGALIVLPEAESYPTKTEFRHLTSNELKQRLDDREHYSLIIWDGKPRLSVAGVQDKINIFLDEKYNMGFGEGAICSTHILKFEKQKLSHLALNEYLTMQLAAKCGLDVAEVQLKYYGKHAALLVKRFDREFVSLKQVKRRHIIDGCQALNLPPEYKYERNFGSGRDVAHIREGVSLQKLFQFAQQCINPALTKKKILDWVLFNLLVYNFDAHGKNISFFINEKGISLTPFYDLVNIKMYQEFDQEMAMALGDEFDSDTVFAYQLADFADSCQISRLLVAKQLKQLINKCYLALASDFASIVKTNAEKNYIRKFIQLVKARCDHFISEIKYINSVEL